MRITDVRIRMRETTESIKAFASIVIDNAMAVHEIKVIEGENGLFIAMPSRRTSEGKFVDIAHPLNTETRNLIQMAVLEAYHNAEKERA